MTRQELISRAFNAFRVKDLDLAERLVGTLLSQQNDNPDMNVFMGNIKTRQGKPDEALRYYRHAIKIKPDGSEAYNNLSVALKMTGRMNKALIAAEKAYTLNPRRADIAYNLGNIYKESNRVEDAIRYYEQAIQTDPTFVPAYNNLGNLYEQTNRHERAQDLYRKGLEYDENNPMLRYNLGVAFDNAGHYDRSLEEYRRVLKRRPGWSDNLNNLAVTLQKLGKNDEALKVFRRGLEVDPDNAKINNNVGVLFTELGRYEEADSYYRKSLSSDPDYVAATVNLGHLHEKTGDYQRAVEEFRNLIKLDPDNLSVKFDLAEALIYENNLKEAYSILSPIYRNEPDNPLSHLSMGNWYAAAGKKKRAAACYSRVLNLDESNTDARMKLALIYKEQRKYEKAIAEVSHILLKKPDSFAPRLLLGELYLKQNLYHEALEIFEALHHEYPDNEDVLSALTHNYKAMGDKEKALKTAEMLATLQGHKGGADDLTRLHSTLELYEEVANEYAEEYEEIWKRNIESLAERPNDNVVKGLQKEEESVILGKLFDIHGETVPIIDTGGIEPYIEINEPSETIILKEIDEDIPDIPDDVPEREIIREKEQYPSGQPFPADRPYSPYPEASKQEQASVTGPEAVPSTPITGQNHPEEHIHVHTEMPAPPAGSLQASLRIESPIVIRSEEQTQEKPKPVILVAKEAPQAPPPGPAPIQQYPPQSPAHAPSPYPQQQDPVVKEKKKESPAELLEYLMSLTRHLPEQERTSFDHSEMRLKIESIREKLRGNPGVLQRYPAGEIPDGIPPKNPDKQVTKKKIQDTLSFMEGLSAFHPDTTLAGTMKNQIQHVLSKLEGSKNDP